MKKYFFILFTLFFLSVSAQDDLEKIKKKYGTIKSYSLNYELVVSAKNSNEEVRIIEESGIMFGNNTSYIIKHENMDVISDGEKIYNIIHDTKEINIVGNTRTFDYVIRRELEVIEGDAIYLSLIHI